MAKISRTAPILTVSVAAELAGMHAQTVRQYDRLGLVVAKRTQGGGRRYSLEDVERLSEIQRLSQDEGINLAGISRILELERQVAKLRKERKRLDRELERAQTVATILHDELSARRARESRVFAVNSTGEVTVAERLDKLRSALRQGGSSRGEVAPYSYSAHAVTLWNPYDDYVVYDDDSAMVEGEFVDSADEAEELNFIDGELIDDDADYADNSERADEGDQ